MDFISVSGSIDTDCSYEHSYDVLWSIKLLGSVTMETVSTASLVMNKLDLTVPARTLSVGEFLLKLSCVCVISSLKEFQCREFRWGYTSHVQILENLDSAVICTTNQPVNRG